MNVDFLLSEAKRVLYPERIELPKEPQPLEQPKPADALNPRNVFPAPSQTPTKEPERREVAAGKTT